MQLEELGFEDVSLIDGEHVDSTLNLTNGLTGEATIAPDLMLLTDRRVIHLHASGKTRRAVFVSLQDIDTVEIASEREGFSGFIWGGLAFVVALVLWRVWDHPVGSALAAVTVALMGAYLIFDQWMSAGAVRVTFNAGSSKLLCGVPSNHASKEVYTFVNRLYQLKGEGAEDGTRRPRAFSPR